MLMCEVAFLLYFSLQILIVSSVYMWYKIFLFTLFRFAPTETPIPLGRPRGVRVLAQEPSFAKAPERLCIMYNTFFGAQNLRFFILATQKI